jgi:hypothetical protein
MIKMDEMGGASSIHAKKKENHIIPWSEHLRGDHLRDIGVDGKIILKRILMKKGVRV